MKNTTVVACLLGALASPAIVDNVSHFYGSMTMYYMETAHVIARKSIRQVQDEVSVYKGNKEFKIKVPSYETYKHYLIVETALGDKYDCPVGEYSYFNSYIGEQVEAIIGEKFMTEIQYCEDVIYG